MQKKIITGIILICLIGIISFSYIFLKKQSQTLKNSVFEVIPNNTAIILDVKNVSDLLSLSNTSYNIWEDLSELPIVQSCNTLINTLDSTIKKNPNFVQFSQNNITITVQQIGQNKLEYAFYAPLSSEDEVKYAPQLITTAFNNLKANSYDYEGISITNLLNPQTNINTLSFAICNNILIVSSSRIFIENAIKCYFDKSHVLSIESFKKVKKTAGDKVVANLYINLNQLSNIAYLFTSDKYKEKLLQESLLASWAEFDITIKENSILLNGFTTTESEKEYFSILKKQTPVKLEITTVIPAGISGFMTLGISDKVLFRKNYEEYLRKTGRFEKYSKNIQLINKTFSSPNQDAINIITNFNTFIDDEIAMVFGNTSSKDIYENSFAIIKTISQTNAKEKILSLMDSYCEKTKTSIDSYVSEYNSTKIYKLPTPIIPETLWGNIFGKVEGNYVTFIDDYILFGKNIESIKEYLYACELQKTMATDAEFKKFQDNLLSTYSFYLYTNIGKSTKIYNDITDDETNLGIEKHDDLLKKFNALAIQISADNDLLYNNIFINHNVVQSDKPHTIWESYIDTAITTKPKFIESNGETLILVQDGFNNLYLLNNAGKIQWKKQLKEHIISEFYPVDYFKNGKTQYACNSKNFMFIIDRNGEFVQNFPLQLKSPASTGMAVFDYENHKDYRIFIPCADKKVYLYSIKGDLIKDWLFKTTESEVTSEIQHFVSNGKDYIVFADKYNTYIVTRRGETRVKVKEQIEKSPNNSFTLEPGKGKTPSRLVTTDVQGNIKLIDFEGNVSTIEMKKRSENHYFEYRDFNNDGSGDYLFIDKNEMEIVTQKNQQLCIYYFEAPITLRPIVYKFSSSTYKTGIVDTQNSKIYLINSNGTLHKGFPLKGTSLFTIGFLNKDSNTFNLIIGGEENFLYNYEIK